MKLYLISQYTNYAHDYYESAVVCTPDAMSAALMDPHTGSNITENNLDADDFWVTDPTKVTVKYLGEAAEGIEQGVVCASFNAG